MTVEMDPDDMTDADKAEVKRKKVSAKEEERLDAAARAQMLSLKPGRRLLYRILENCGMFQNCIAADANATLVLVGGHMKAVALWSELIATSPALVGEMIKENGR